MTLKTVSATEARVHFGELMRRVVEEQEPVIVARGGQPQVVVVSLEQYDQLVANQAQEPDWRTLLRETHLRISRELDDQKLPAADELIHQMREERDEQLLETLSGL